MEQTRAIIVDQGAQMTAKEIAELIIASTAPITITLIILRAILIARHSPKYRLGPVTIQLAALGTLVPLLLILALEGILKEPILGTLIGGMAGYAIAGRASQLTDDP
jgi:hypothetical protein